MTYNLEWAFPLALVSIMVVSLLTAIKSIVYCGNHPSGKRRTGAWMLAFACSGLIVNAIKWIAEGMASDKFFMLIIVLMLIMVLVSAMLLLSRNPAPVVDRDDYDVIMTHIEMAECEFARQIREIRSGKIP